MTDTYSVVIRFTFEAEDVADAIELSEIIGHTASVDHLLASYEVVRVEEGA